MSQPENSEQPQQRFCTSCGAEIRAGTSFCISCGASLAPNPGTTASTHDAVALDSESEPEGGAGSTRPAQGESQAARPMGSSADSQYDVEANTTSKFLNRVINWFRNLSSVPKLIIAGLLLVLLLTVLSPVARVVAIVVFVVSAVVLTVRAIQRKPLRGWVIAVVGSLVLIPVFGGISGAIYGSGSIGGISLNLGPEDDSNTPDSVIPQVSPSNPTDLYSVGPVYQDTPYYEVDSLDSADSGGASGTILVDTTVEHCERDKKLVMEDIAAQTENFDWWTFSVYSHGSFFVEGIEWQESLAFLGVTHLTQRIALVV